MNLSKLLAAAFPGEVPALPETVAVTAITADSRQCHPGCVFVAIPGTTVDGGRYAHEAVERGAVAVVTERTLGLPEDAVQVLVPDSRAAVADLAAAFYDHPARDMTVVGITGTNGKTSSSLILRSIFEAAGEKTAVFGTIAYEVGERRIPAPTTTPDPVSLMGYLAEARDQGIRHVVMEVSSHALRQQRTRGIEMAAGVFTNLAPEHLDYHLDFADYRAAKSLLFEGLGPKARAVLNGEDPAANHIASRTRAAVLRYGTREAAAVRARSIRCGTSGISFVLVLPDGEVEIRSPLLGRINVMNCLAAAGAASSLGVDPAAIREGINSVSRVAGRLEPVDEGQPFTVLVDYAHTDHALLNVLKSIRTFSGNRRITTLIGCGGDRDRAKRPRMGRVASDLSDHVVITSDNPRSEDPMAIVRDILAGLEGRTNFEVQVDRRKAISAALRDARPTDIVLVAGKGHETYQIISGVVVPFDDRQVVREEIRRQTEERVGDEGSASA
jgi:UDP-N-acetylmuramoyl-L-alanyl-D-glutamate--2,6-diaminopimelate ligase